MIYNICINGREGYNSCGYDSVQFNVRKRTHYALCHTRESDRRSPSPTCNIVSEKILKRYRDLNRDWLLTGKGEMLNSETKEPNSNEEDMQMKELIAAFRENREMLAEALDQNSRLIGVIERMQGIDRSATGVQKSSPPHVFRTETE